MDLVSDPGTVKGLQEFVIQLKHSAILISLAIVWGRKHDRLGFRVTWSQTLWFLSQSSQVSTLPVESRQNSDMAAYLGSHGWTRIGQRECLNPARPHQRPQVAAQLLQSLCKYARKSTKHKDSVRKWNLREPFAGMASPERKSLTMGTISVAMQGS